MCKYLTNYFSGNKIFLVTFLGKTQIYKDATTPSHNRDGKFSYGPWSNFENYLALENYPGAIDYITEDTFDYNNNIYDISGRRLVQDYDGSSPLDLKPGIYIYKGKKVMIK